MKKKNSRKNKFVYNTIASITNQIMLIISGFVIPKYMLSFYGSEINGLVSSISQFLGFISFMQARVGVVVQAALYDPINRDDWIKVSEIYKSAQRFFRTIAYIFIGYTLFVSVVYPIITKTPFSNTYVFALVWVISINLFSQFYFSITNTLLLNADQKAYVSLGISTIMVILNIIVSTALMYLECDILMMKLFSNIVCLFSPISITIYVQKNYPLNRKITYDSEPIKQKWSGFAQHISAVIVDNTDIIVLTIFSTLTNVSIYSVYYMVVSAIKQLLISFTGGIQSLFGSMLAKKEEEKLYNTFNMFELIFSWITTFMFSTTITLIVPFIRVYTLEIKDANYEKPVFAVLLSLAFAIFCYRTIYYTLIKAAGHFKETQTGAIIEVIINLLVSITLVKRIGLLGVAIGTCLAVLYRTIYCVWYLSHNLIKRPMLLFFKNMFINVLAYTICIWLGHNFNIKEYTYLSWIILAIKQSIINLIIIFILYMLFYREKMLHAVKIFTKKK